MQKKPSYFSLTDIAAWTEEGAVSLPTVQRGFVWRPFQIENLWDSLLRGYPAGAFVLLPNNEDNKYEILDGQQRATSISLGFNKKTLKESHKYIKVFIDLERIRIDDTRKFIFRVITRSHPWGYKKQDNSKTLTASEIRQAMDLYDVSDPLKEELNSFFPFDCILPVPFHLFLDAFVAGESAQETYSNICNWKHWPKVKERWLCRSNKSGQDLEKIEIDKELIGKINFIAKYVSRMLNPESGQRIPALYLNKNIVPDDDDVEPLVDELPEELPDEIENLFVRLNAGGTQLAGEELNYSILKSRLQTTTQEKLEEACKSLFRPSRFITVAYRLFQQSKDSGQSDALTMRIKPKQFQRAISNQASKFEEFLLEITGEKKYDDNTKTLLEHIQDILAYNKDSQNFGLPFLMYSKISDTAPELIFLLMYRIKEKGDNFSQSNPEREEERRKLIGMITLFLWFGRGENLKDHSKLLSKIWVTASKFNKKDFWSKQTVERASIENVLLPIPSYYSTNKDIGLEKILDYKINENSNILYKYEKEAGEEYHLFLQKVIYNRDLILYAQRQFIESYFRQQQYRLEDTSLPFDWDHISPNSFVSNKRNIPQIVNYWYQSNGNYRAWPYALNRMDSDNSPDKKLKPLFAQNFQSEQNKMEMTKKWEAFISKNNNMIDDLSQIDQKLLNWSFCEPGWAACQIHNIKNEWKDVTHLIIERNILIMKELYSALLIEEIRKETNITLDEIIDKRKWKSLPLENEKFDKYFNHQEKRIRLKGPLLINTIEFYFFISYPNELSYQLEENNIEMGLFEFSETSFILNIDHESLLKSYILKNDSKRIYSTFTLASSTIESGKLLVKEFKNWIDNLPLSTDDKKILETELNESFTTKFRNMEYNQ